MDAALAHPSVRDEALGILSRLGAPQSAFAREGGVALSPITGELIAQVRTTSFEEVGVVVGRATEASEKTPLTALATQAIVERAMRRFGNAPDGLSGVVIGGRDIGQALVADARVAVVSATGSTAMGRDIGPRLAARFARAILELGGNNAGIVAPSADLDLAVRAIAFAAMGTAGPALYHIAAVVRT